MSSTRAQMLFPSAIYKHFISPPKAKNLEIKGKSVLITGGNCGIGKCAVQEMVKNGAKSVTILARNKETADQVIADCKELNVECELRFVKLDLGDQKAIKSVVEDQLQCNYDVIIGNSGVFPKSLKRTVDDFELCFGVNHLGHYTLINHYLNTTKHFPQRITLTSSTAHLNNPNGINFDVPNYHSIKYNYADAYGQSKMANILFARKLAVKLDGKTIVNHIHPGVVATELFRELVPKFITKLVMRSEIDGCQSLLQAAFNSEITETGIYYSNCQKSEQYLNSAAKDPMQTTKLWEISKELTGIDLNL